MPFIVEIVVLAVLLNFVVNIIVVPSGSMLPTIAEHSLLLCPRVYNPEKRLQRGDIASFRSDELDKTLIKRLIGLPGEHVAIDENGNLYIDDQLLEEDYVVFQQTDFPCEFNVPEDSFLFLGDNRSGSYDAREWDDPYVPIDQVINKAKFTIWPLKNWGTLK